MVLLSKNYDKYICLIALILLQLVGNSSAKNLTCVQCGGSGDKCKDPLTDQLKECSDDTFKKCFTQIDTKGIIERGCRKPADESTCKDNCALSDGEKNTQLVCKNCEGSDENCSHAILGYANYSKICKDNEKNCVMKVENKLVVRSCAADVSQCTEANICQSCTTDICNADIFPKDRIKCYQCNGSGCNDLKPENSTTCPNYENKDECYTKGDSETNMIRGCKSDTNENKCSPTAEGCLFCNESNCNSLQYKRDQALQCYQCTGDETHTDCFQAQASQSFNKCEKQILYNQSENCYTQYANGNIKRGCLHDDAALTVENCNSTNCKTCNKNGCNKEISEFTCVRCRSDINKKCWNNAKEVSGERCRSESTTEKDGCFSGVWHGVAIRGCVVDASAQTQSICIDNKNPQCTICHTKDCNTKKSSGTRNVLSNTLMLIVCITLWKFK